jgi:hypothetical protein
VVEIIADGYCIVNETGGSPIRSRGTNLGPGHVQPVFPTVRVHAVKVTAGAPEQGDSEGMVRTSCGRALSRSQVYQGRSWAEQLKLPVDDVYIGSSPPRCEECRRLTPEV